MCTKNKMYEYLFHLPIDDATKMDLNCKKLDIEHNCMGGSLVHDLLEIAVLIIRKINPGLISVQRLEIGDL